jgi:hypothetical protein
MNTHNVVSKEMATDLAGKEHHTLKLTSTGVTLAASTDRIIGTLMRAGVKQEAGFVAGKTACDIYLAKGGYVAYAVLGATSAAIALGAGLIADSANPGKLVPSESNPIALAWQAINGADGSIFQVLFL